jgi:hypothetical protein
MFHKNHNSLSTLGMKGRQIELLGFVWFTRGFQEIMGYWVLGSEENTLGFGKFLGKLGINRLTTLESNMLLEMGIYSSAGIIPTNP